MKKIFLIVFLFLLQSCYRYVETNPLAIPPIAKEELKTTTSEK